MTAPAPTPQPAQPPSGAAPGVFKDPYGAYNFKLVIQGVTDGEAHFYSCTGIGIHVKAEKWREGGTSQVVHWLPSWAEPTPVTLRYGLSASKELWLWLDSAAKGTVQRRNVSIIVLGRDGVTEAVRYNLLNAWPTSWAGAPLNAMEHQVAIAELTVVGETLELAS
jgi:phage tail-like protein